MIKLHTIYKSEKNEKENIDTIKKSFIHTDTGQFNDSSENSNNSLITNSINYNVINNNIHNDKDTTIKSNENNIFDADNNKYGDCIIEIPSINLSKIVYTGIDREHHLDNYELITAASDMNYSNGGNYIICGHASRLFGHSLNRLKELKKGDLVYASNSDSEDIYIVDKIYFANMDDTDKYCRQTDQKEITIISCAKYVSKESYIVVKAIPKTGKK